MTGVRLWKNPKNKFCVFEAHYTADPDKRSEEFRQDKKNSLPLRKFLMEYEIHWESFSGLPVFGDTWNNKVHLVQKEIKPELGLPILIGWDWGLTPAAVIAQLSGSRLMVMREFVASNMGAARFIPLVIRQLKLLYPLWATLSKDYLNFIDPSGAFRKDTDESTCKDFLYENGFREIIPGAIPFQERQSSVESFLTQMQGGEACFQISAAHCPILIKGFQGGYQFKEGQDEIEPNKLEPEKNNYSHPHDALQMITSRIGKITRSGRANVPVPSYSWSQSAKS